MSELNIGEIETRKEAAHKMIKDLCRRKNDPQSRDWVMSIPAREDYDPDLVIGASLRDIPKLIAKLASAREVIEHCELNHHRHSIRARKWLEENAE